MLGNSQTDTKVNTEDNFSGFQLIIKERSNKNKKQWKKTMSDGNRTLNLHHGTPWETDALTTRPFLHLEVVENEHIVSKQYYVT